MIRLLSQPEFGLDERKANEIVDSIKDWIDADNSALPVMEPKLLITLL